MKSFITLILFSSFLFSSCSQTPDIVNDICSITSEICHYSEIICSNFNSAILPVKDQEKIKKQLQLVAEDLKYISNVNPDLVKSRAASRDDKIKYYLMQHRDLLKEIAEETLK